MPQTTRNRKVTLRDIAEEANVSIAAVSKALADHPQISDATKKRVRRISRDLNYQPRRRGTHPPVRTKRIALLIVGATKPPVYLLPLISHLRAVRPEGAAMSLEIATIPDPDDPAAFDQVDQLASRFDGLIMDGTVTEPLFRHASSQPVPCVLLGSVGGDPLKQYDCGFMVAVDVRAMGQHAARRLIDLGRRRIAFICSHLRSNFWFDQWLQGYRHAHVDAGVPIHPELIMTHGGAPRADDLDPAQPVSAGATGAIHVRRSPRKPDGFIIPDAGTAVQFINDMALSGVRIDGDDLVYGASYHEAHTAMLMPFCSLDIDIINLSRVGLHTLALAMRGHVEPPLKIIVPFREEGGSTEAARGA